MSKIAIVQMSIDDVQSNLVKAKKYISLAAKENADIICFPEGFLWHYLPQYPRNTDNTDYAVTIDDECVTRLQKLCKDNHIIACISLNLKEEDKVYAAAVIISEEGEILGIGRKNHIVRKENYYEADYYAKGQGYVCTKTSKGRIGMIMCFDRHYAESYKSLTEQGVDFIYIPVANDVTEDNELYKWEIKVAAYQNVVPIVMCNRVGTEGRMTFSGKSMAVDAGGNELVACEGKEQIVFFDMDFERNADIRKQSQFKLS